MDSENRPQDDVSRLATQDGAAVGVHRAPTRIWTRVVSAFAIFLLAGGATYGYFYAKSNWSIFASPEPSVSPTATASWTPFVTPSTTPSASPSPSISVAPPDIRYGSKILVYNDSKQSGLAGKVKGIILDGGEFTKVATGNWDGAKPPANVIRYNDEKLRDTVDLLAKLLNIKAVAFGLTESRPIEIVLVTDPFPDADPSPAPST